MRYYITVFISLIFSCNSRKLNNEEVLSLKNEILQGKTSSYEKLSSYYFENGRIDSLLSYSKIMAGKFDYAHAYYDMFEIIYLTNSGECIDYNLSCLDDEEKKVALNYLIEAIKRGDKTASGVLLNFYDDDKSYPIKELYENSELIRIAKLNKGL